MRGFLIFIVILLCTGCSKEEEGSSFAPFIGTWIGRISNINAPQDVHSVTFHLNKGDFSFTGDIIPDYRYVLFASEVEGLKEGEMMVILHSSSPHDYTVKAIFNPLGVNELNATVDIRDVGKYEGILSLKF